MKRFAWCGGVVVACLVAIPTDGRAAWRSEGPGLGVVSDVAVDPAQPDTIYAATSGGGVWRSEDGGRSWALPGGEMTSRDVTWVEVDPKNPATVWAGVDATGRPGLWRSLDRGKTWAVVRVDATSSAVGWPIAFAPSDPRTVFVPSTNLHYRSADGGKTWVSFRVPGQDAYAFAIHPEKPTIVYAGGRGTEHNLCRSLDGGRTWRPWGRGLTNNASIKRLLISPLSPSTLYAVAGFGLLHRSRDGGETWTELELGLRGTDELYSLKLDPHDAQVLLAATKKGLRRSKDGGDTWTSVGEDTGGYLCTGIAFHPTRRDTVYAGAGGSGFFMSSDGGRTFQPSSAGLNAGWTQKLYAPAGSVEPIFAQLSVGLFRMDGPGSWREIQAPFSPGEPAQVDGVVFDRDAPKKVYVHHTSRWWRSEDSGRSWSAIEVPEPSLRNMMKGNLSHPEFKSLVQDPVDGKTFYAGAFSSSLAGAAVFKTTNAGKKWEPAGSGLPADGGILLLRSSASGTVFAVAGKEGIYRTSDGGKAWRLVRPGDVQDLAVDPAKPERVFVATDKGLFRSTDSGETWTQVTQGLKGDDVEAVVASRDGQVFAGTFYGVFRSADGGATWSALNDGLLNTDVRALAISGGAPSRLYAGLAGGSVFSTELP
jgi:photosystem II stability/assembly factor-like uncharacterized protein